MGLVRRLIKQFIEGIQNVGFLVEKLNARLIFTLNCLTIVMFEAMACGLPIIVPFVGEIRQRVINEKRSILTQTGNIKRLKSTILNLVSDKELKLKEKRDNLGGKDLEMGLSVCYDRVGKLEKTMQEIIVVI